MKMILKVYTILGVRSNIVIDLPEGVGNVELESITYNNADYIAEKILNKEIVAGKDFSSEMEDQFWETMTYDYEIV